MTKSLFARVSRYRTSIALDPAENRLTEAFAAVLEHVPDVAVALARAMTGTTPPNSRVTVRSQRTTLSGGFLDLELSFGPANAPDVLIWIEVKHGAGLHGHQLDVYAHDISAEPAGERHLILLAPRTSMPPAVAGFQPFEWQQIARILRAWRKAEAREPVAAWLVEQFISYLKEEGLADEETLTPAHVFAFAARRAADRAIARVIEIADVYVSEHWGLRTGYAKSGNKPNYGPDWWAAVAVAPSGQSEPASWRATHFEWSFRKDRANPESSDGYAFTAGATFTSAKDNPAAIAENQPWLAAHTQNGFAYTQDWYWRLWWFRYPEELLVERTIDNQGRLLGAWVVETFQLLALTPPPA